MQGADSPASASTATSPTQYALYRNTQWHFALEAPSTVTASGPYDNDGGQTIQFLAPDGNELFQVSAWPYHDFDVALGEEAPAGSAQDEPDTLGIVHVYHGDMFEMTFVKDGISYVVQSLPEYATTTLDILKSWHFI